MRNYDTTYFYKNFEYNEDPKLYFNTGSIGLYNLKSRDHTEDWDVAVKNVQTEFIKFLLGKNANEHLVHIFHNTTAGIQRVFHILNKRIFHSKSNLLTTDAEYPGIIAAAYENWGGDMHIVEIDRLIWENKTEKVLDKVKKAFLLTKPQVFFISHIFRSTGYTFPLEKMIDFIKKIKPDTIIVVDGAQAVGNIVIKKEILDRIDFYITSAHKWLCGETTLGLAYAQKGWDLEDPAQSYSLKLCSAGTGIMNVLYSAYDAIKCLNESANNEKRFIELIEQGNRTKALLFMNELKNIDGLDFIKFSQEKVDRNGIVVFTTKKSLNKDFFKLDKKSNRRFSATSLSSELFLGSKGFVKDNNNFIEKKDNNSKIFLSEDRYSLRLLDNEILIEKFNEASTTYIPPKGVCRVCFHFYHSEDDVRKFASFIKERYSKL